MERLSFFGGKTVCCLTVLSSAAIADVKEGNEKRNSKMIPSVWDSFAVANFKLSN